MVNKFYIISALFFALFVLDVIAIAVTAIRFNEDNHNRNVLTILQLKANINAFISVLWLVVTLSIHFGW